MRRTTVAALALVVSIALVSVPIPNVGVYIPNVGVYNPNVGVYNPNVGVYNPNVGVYIPSVADHITFYNGHSSSYSGLFLNEIIAVPTGIAAFIGVGEPGEGRPKKRMVPGAPPFDPDEFKPEVLAIAELAGLEPDRVWVEFTELLTSTELRDDAKVRREQERDTQRTAGIPLPQVETYQAWLAIARLREKHKVGADQNFSRVRDRHARALKGPWAGRPGWDEEFEIPIVTREVEVDDGRGGKSKGHIPVEPAYAIYNELVGERSYRPFRLSTGEPRVAVPTPFGLVTLDPKDPEFGAWIGFNEYTRVGKPVPRKALGAVTTALAQRAIARDLPSERIVTLAIRLAARRPVGSYLDMCDERCRTIVVGPEGWGIQQVGAPVFDRPRHMKPLPDPVPSGQGTVDLLWNHVLVAPGDETQPQRGGEPATGQRLLILADLVQQLVYPASAKTVTIFGGNDGAGKTSSAKRHGDVLDPSLTPTLAPPKKGEERELEDAARNRFSLRIDNVSHVSPDLSDAICRLQSGVGIAHRMLYTDRDESVSAAWNKVSLNGIAAIPTASDLLRRVVVVDTVAPEALGLRRLGDADLEEAWNRDQPSILGGLLDAAVRVMCCLRDDPTVDPGAPDSASYTMSEYVRVGRALSIVLHKTCDRFDEAWGANLDRQAGGAMQDPRVAALVEFWRARPIDASSVGAEELARWISDACRTAHPDGVSPVQAGRLMARSVRLLETQRVYLEKRTEHNQAVYRRIERAARGIAQAGGSSPPTPPIESYKDEEAGGGVAGGVSGEDGPCSPGQLPPGEDYSPGVTANSPAGSSDEESRKEGSRGVAGALSEKPNAVSVGTLSPGPAMEETDNWSVSPRDRSRPRDPQRDGP